MRNTKAWVGVALASSVGVASGMAAILNNPGVSAPFPNTAAALNPLDQVASFSTGVVADDAGNFSTRVVSRVYDLGAGNPLGAGGLTFTYTVENVNDGGPLNADLFALAVNFGNVGTVDVDSVVGGGNVPNIALYFGNQLAFIFASTSIEDSEISTTLIVHTTYPAWQKAKAGVIDTTTEDVDALVPLIPEPSSYAGLFALGIAGFAAYRRFRA